MPWLAVFRWSVLLALGFALVALSLHQPQYWVALVCLIPAALLGDFLRDTFFTAGRVRWGALVRVLAPTLCLFGMGLYFHIPLLIVPAYALLMAVPFAWFWDAPRVRFGCLKIKQPT